MQPFSQRQSSSTSASGISDASKIIPKMRRRASPTKPARDDVDLLFQKLIHMIPSLPKDRKLTKLEILQAVIDYIQELEERLQSHPDAENLCSGLTRLKLSLAHARMVPHENAQ